jgi:hypothetical protein
MKTFRIVFALLALALGSNSWGQVYTKFGPATGVLKGSTSTYQTTAASSTDVIGLWSGCTGTNFLRGDGTCQTPAGVAPSGATNLVYATPNGSTGSATLRALVGADLPTINLGSTAAGGVLSTSILLGTNGGTSNGFFSVTGPTTALRTFTFPNASASVLTSAAAVTVAQGGTGVGTLTGLVLGNGTAAFSAAASSNVISLWSGTCNSTTFLRGDGACASAGGGAVGGSTTQIQYNNAGVFGGTSNFTFNNATGAFTIAAPTTGVALTVNALNNSEAMDVNGGATSGQSFGLSILAGTTTADYGLLIRNQPGTATLFKVGGDGNISQSGSIAGGIQNTITNTNAGAFAFSLMGLRNSGANDFSMAFTSPAYGTFLTSGPTGAAGYLYSNQNIPVCIGRASTADFCINVGGSVTVPGPVRSASGSSPQTTGTVTTVFAVPNTGTSSWLVTCEYGTAMAVSWFFESGTSLTQTTISTNGTVATSVNTGLNIACTQTSGSTQTVGWSVFRFGA